MLNEENQNKTISVEFPSQWTYIILQKKVKQKNTFYDKYNFLLTIKDEFQI